MDINHLNERFSIAGQLVIVEGNGGFPFIHIHNQHADALISLYGGQILSYRPKGHDELMFLSKKAFFEEGKAIKGGVPVCWPWFGPHPTEKSLPAHGFVRNRMWKVVHTETTQDAATRVSLGIESSPETLSMWPHDFRLTLDITVGKTILLKLTTRNTGDQHFSISQALHSYFSVGDISLTTLSGLDAKQYIDKTDNGVTKTQHGDVTVHTEVDRVYYDVPASLTIADKSNQRHIEITSEGNNTAVVWNPWSKISIASADLLDDDYQRFLCVETANALMDVVEIPAGNEYSLITEIGIHFDN